MVVSKVFLFLGASDIKISQAFANATIGFDTTKNGFSMFRIVLHLFVCESLEN